MTDGEARPAGGKRTDAKTSLLQAAERILRTEGYQALSTRHVALTGGMPLSQIHYHFGGKEGLILALLDHLDAGTLGRQQRMFSSDQPLSRRWHQACEFLDEDIASGYVRLLQECIALGWTNDSVAEKVRAILNQWSELLTGVAEEAERQFGALGPFTPAEMAELAGKAFLGAESVLLLDIDANRQPIRSALERVGDVIHELEQRGGMR